MVKKIKSFLNKLNNLKKYWGCKLTIKIIIIPTLFKKPRVKHKAILSYLKTKYAGLIDKYKNIQQPDVRLNEDCPIWICWFQGEEQMPPIVKGCYASVKRHAGKHPIKLITIDNYNQYISIPDYIINKLNNRQISFTHFSDIIRNKLLANHGGIWLDATIYLTDELRNWNLPFNSIKQQIFNDYTYVSQYKWTGFCMGGSKGNILNSFITDFFNIYHQKEKSLLDYLLIDYVIAFGYNEIPSIKKLIDDIPYSNPDLYYLQKNMNQPTNEEELRLVLQRTSIFKLNWRTEPPTDKHALYYNLGFDKSK